MRDKAAADEAHFIIVSAAMDFLSRALVAASQSGVTVHITLTEPQFPGDSQGLSWSFARYYTKKDSQ